MAANVGSRFRHVGPGLIGKIDILSVEIGFDYPRMTGFVNIVLSLRRTEMRFIDLTGQWFGRLIVESLSGKVPSGNRTRPMWNCRCDCGRTTITTTGSLRSGDTRSCGCLVVEMMTRPIPNIEAIARDYNSKISLASLESKYNIPRSTIRLHLIAFGVQMRKVSDWMQDYPDLGSRTRGRRFTMTDEHKENIRAARIEWGEKNAVGVSLKPSGYVEYTRGPNKGRGVHRVLAEKREGRQLLRSEHVHHDDEIKSNNDPSNLKLLPLREHMRLHALKNVKLRKRDARGRFS